ncbi:membrane protein of unknown function [Beijerinckiaceae bacterium RH CH11]|nr:cytochrome b/b6 domain-containing protein [Beijerinckiaceae bacterium]VVB43586.1 membrane protein of unknown function [Beijerinckiaceae bacterium RH AL8]VVB43605.1 membrane protein of unknown function [Beijerinckiaceae bacterium RH CH11]
MPLELGPRGSDMRRYTIGARWFHWITAVLMFIVIPLGWIFGAFKTKPGHPDVYVAPFPGTPDDYAAAHMSVGLVLFAIVAARIFYRIMNPPPALPGTMGRWEQRLAHLTHWLLYAVLIIMPVSGYVMSAGDKPPISFLGLGRRAEDAGLPRRGQGGGDRPRADHPVRGLWADRPAPGGYRLASVRPPGRRS